MLMAQSPEAGIQKLQPKSARKPLLPIKNIPANIPIHDGTKPNPKPSEEDWIEMSTTNLSNKENHPIHVTPTKEIGLAEASLAEELIAIRKKLERMRLDKEKTGKMMLEKNMALECWMKELEQRGQAQKMLEIEVDRLFRLKELKFMRVSPIRSLREKEGERKIRGAQVLINHVVKEEGEEESIDESALQSPISESSEEITEE